MCLPGQPPAPPAGPVSAADAVAMAEAGLAALAGVAAVDAAGLTAAVQADCLRALERAEAVHAAARARVLAAFYAGDGGRDDGHGSAKMWLRWQTRITRGAGAELADLAGLAEEIRRRTARPDRDGDDGFTGRGLSLDVTFGQAGRLTGELTPQCPAALPAVLEALGTKAGPEDLRTVWQRRHDALEEAYRRLIAAGCVPGRAGQPTQIQVRMTLDQLRGRPGRRGDGTGPGGYSTGPAGPAGPGSAGGQAGPGGPPRQPGAGGGPDPAPGRRMRAERAVRRLIVARAVDLLSGPGGLASYLRTRLPDDLVASVSLPLDTGAVTDTIPAHLRRARGGPGPALPVPRLHPARHHLPAAPHHPPLPGRAGLPGQPDQPLRVSPPHRDSPVGLGHNPAPRRHRHRHQPRRPHPALPQPPSHRRLTGRARLSRPGVPDL